MVSMDPQVELEEALLVETTETTETRENPSGATKLPSYILDVPGKKDQKTYIAALVSEMSRSKGLIHPSYVFRNLLMSLLSFNPLPL